MFPLSNVTAPAVAPKIKRASRFAPLALVALRDEAADFIVESVRNVGYEPAEEINLKLDTTSQDRCSRFKEIP